MLQRSPSSISHELNRNTGANGYTHRRAHSKACARQQQRRNASEISGSQWAHVDSYLRERLSPQQVAGRLKLEGAFDISQETIYQHIYADKRSGSALVECLRGQKLYRKRYASGQQRQGKLVEWVCIEQRPSVVDEKIRIGDWEGDTVVGKNHQGALVTLVERKSRYTLCQQVHSKHSEGITQAIIGLLRPHKAQCLTLTFDNGKEFAQHSYIGECLQANVYFAHPYRS